MNNFNNNNNYNPFLNTFYEDLIKRQASNEERIPTNTSNQENKVKKIGIKPIIKKGGRRNG